MTLRRSSITTLLILTWSALSAAAEPEKPLRLLFTGDILLSREVRSEIDSTGRFPWRDFQPLFQKADWVAGNLEGAVGPRESCLPSSTEKGPCFDIAPDSLGLLKTAGFQALGVENNHSADLGDSGREATLRALSQSGLAALRYEDSPSFFNLGEITMGVIALTNVAGRDGRRSRSPPLYSGKNYAWPGASPTWWWFSSTGEPSSSIGRSPPSAARPIGW